MYAEARRRGDRERSAHKGLLNGAAPVLLQAKGEFSVRRQFRQSPSLERARRPRAQGVHDALTVPPQSRQATAAILAISGLERARRPRTQSAYEQFRSSLYTDVALKPARPAHLDVRIATSRSRSPPRRHRARRPAAHPTDGSAASPRRPPAEWRR